MPLLVISRQNTNVKEQEGSYDEHIWQQATAHVLRRERSLVYLDVEVHSVSGNNIARSLVTYKPG